MNAAIDPRQAERARKGAFTGAAVAFLGTVPLVYLASDMYVGVIIFTVLGVAAGSVGAEERNRLRAVCLGGLSFTIVPGTLLIMGILLAGMTRWLHIAGVLRIVSTLIGVSAMGSLCGLVGHIVGRTVPRPEEEPLRLQFGISDLLMVAILLGLFLGLVRHAFSGWLWLQ